MDERVEDQLVATVSILLPSVEFVVTSQRDTFLEAAARVCRPPDAVAFQLQTESHVEVLRHVGF